MRHAFAVMLLASSAAGCTMVDTTEHCVETRYGKVINEKMGTGLNATIFTKATCFNLTEQNFPERGEVETIQAQTRDPITVTGDLALVFSFDPATVGEVFREKRSQDAALVEILNAVREGYRNAMAAWTVSEIFSERRAEVGDSVKAHIQRKVGDRARIQQVFVRDIKIPPQIEEARINAARQAQILAQARQQFVIDSVNAAASLMKANAEAQAKELSARAYAQNPRLLELEVARAMADGLARTCAGPAITSCVIGGSVMDAWRRQ